MLAPVCTRVFWGFFYPLFLSLSLQRVIHTKDQQEREALVLKIVLFGGFLKFGIKDFYSETICLAALTVLNRSSCAQLNG